MSRTFAYCRVSTTDQTTENQVRDIRALAPEIDPRRIVTEAVSGSLAAAERPAFARLVDRLEAGDLLIVTKLDRLGRNAMDVRATVERLAAMGVRVKCLALGDTDLTSSAGKLVMQIIAAMAEFERDLLIERTQAGLDRARAEGKTLGRPPVLSEAQQADARRRLDAGEPLATVAKTLKVSRAALYRLKARAT
jgi:putative DNA-invertase from lambdoid prophage Rac